MPSQIKNNDLVIIIFWQNNFIWHILYCVESQIFNPFNIAKHFPKFSQEY